MSDGNSNLVSTRRAIEALRAGVPNQDAVRALGSNQPTSSRVFGKSFSGFERQGVDQGF